MEEDRRLEVIEMRMLRNICRISLKEYKRNSDVRKLARVVNISEKVKDD